MKHFIGVALIVCFVSCMVSCGSPNNNQIKEKNKEISAVTEIGSSFSSQLDITTTFFERTTLNTDKLTSAAEVDSEQTETNLKTSTTATAAEIKQKTKEAITPTTYIETTGQIVEEPITETVTKLAKTTIKAEETIAETEIDNSVVGIDSYSYQLLAELIEHEAGCSWLNIYDKAHIAAAVMNRVYDVRFPDTVYDNLIDQSQFPGYYPGCIMPSAAAYEALDYYLIHSNEFDNSNSWFGDGTTNYFYFQ